MAKHIYVHIPFCERKCDYCDFYSVACNSSEKMESYFSALNEEIELTEVIEDTNTDLIDTVYFGGGTPSVPDASFLADTLKHIISKFDINPDAEITIECNPHSVTYEKFVSYFNAGFNRVSIGVQSLNESTLKVLGRLHNRNRAIEAINEAKKAGFKNISADLMVGIPNQTLEEVLTNGKELINLNVNHVSMYSLIIEEGTKFYDRYIDTLDTLVPPELERQMYHELRKLLKDNGITPYEISNCGNLSIHNMSYWKGFEYYAFGPAASGYLNKKRFTHDPDINKYIEVLNSTNPSMEEIYEIDEEITIDESMREYCMLMLRTSEGISKDEFSKRFGSDVDSIFKNEISNLIKKELLFDKGQTYSLTIKGLDFANEAFREFI